MIGIIWAIIVFLVILWIIGFLIVHVGGALINILLVVALILLIWNLLFAPRAV